MQLWGKIIKHDRIQKQDEVDYDLQSDWTEESLQEALVVLSRQMDLSRPVILRKHVEQMNRYGKTSFYQEDFVEPIYFKRLDIEWLGERNNSMDDYARMMNDFSS